MVRRREIAGRGFGHCQGQYFPSKSASQGRSVAVVWRVQQINPFSFPGRVSLASSTHPNLATPQGRAFGYSPKFVGGQKEAQWLYI